jgi:YD repeat-containing protein
MILVVFAVALSQSVSGTRAAAQNPNSCLGYMTWAPLAEGAYPTGWSFYALYPGTFTVVIASYTANCASGAAAEETRSKCPYCNKPISLATGNTSIEQRDVSLPGLGGGLRLVRTWNSIWPSTQLANQVGLFGPHWRSNFEESVFTGSDGTMKYARGDGSYWSFGSGTGKPLAPANVIATLTSGTSYWTITFQNGEQRRFDNASGSLIAIVDPNGNTTSLSYDGTNRLTTVADPASRHLTFTYGNASFPRLVTGVSSDVGLSLSYAYDAQGRLTQITMPDLSTLNFAYDANSFITSVTDALGKVLEAHTYDSQGRGLTASQANGVNAVTVTYPQ